MASLFLKLINWLVDGKTEIIYAYIGKKKYKYTIPASWQLVQHHKSGHHNNNKGSLGDEQDQPHHRKDYYTHCDHLIPLANQALERGHTEAFFAIYCLIADIYKHDHPQDSCSFVPKHLDHEILEGAGQPAPEDIRAAKRIRRFAMIMETVQVPFLGQVGLGFLFDLIIGFGPPFRFVISYSAYREMAQMLGLPSWFMRRLVRRLLWATAFPFFLPGAGDILGAHIGADSAAAHDIGHYVNLRSEFRCDDSLDDNTYVSHGLAELFGEYHKPLVWRYSRDVRNEILGRK